jgi:redox-sensitive bicupin YhaK (pirin superfamily)
MVDPAYQEVKDALIPRASQNGVHVKVIAGTSMNITSPVFTRTPTMYLDFTLEPNASFSQPVQKHWNALIYVLNGSGIFGSNQLKANQRQTVIFKKDQGDSIEFKNSGNEQLRVLLIAGQPLNEPGNVK